MRTGFAVCFWASSASVLLSAFFETFLEDEGDDASVGDAEKEFLDDDA